MGWTAMCLCRCYYDVLCICNWCHRSLWELNVTCWLVNTLQSSQRNMETVNNNRYRDCCWLCSQKLFYFNSSSMLKFCVLADVLRRRWLYAHRLTAPLCTVSLCHLLSHRLTAPLCAFSRCHVLSRRLTAPLCTVSLCHLLCWQHRCVLSACVTC